MEKGEKHNPNVIIIGGLYMIFSASLKKPTHFQYISKIINQG